MLSSGISGFIVLVDILRVIILMSGDFFMWRSHLVKSYISIT